jgi:hypothetical protein
MSIFGWELIYSANNITNNYLTSMATSLRTNTQDWFASELVAYPSTKNFSVVIPFSYVDAED